MLELILVLMSILYSAFFSINWLWCLPAALGIAAIKRYFRTRK